MPLQQPHQHLIVAMPLEAKALLPFFGLKKLTHAPTFEVYRRDNLWLTISGIGKVASAAAVAYTYMLAGHNSFSSWLNVGIAGHGHVELGDLFAAHKITDGDTGHSHYPSLTYTLPCQTEEVFTVPKPVTDYPARGLFEMEASGFYYTATRFTSNELVQCLKVVSDTHHHPIESITPAWIEQNIKHHLESIEQVLQSQKALLDELEVAHHIPNNFEAIAQKWRFSQQQKMQLQQLLRRWHLIWGDTASVESAISDCRSSRECLQTLRNTLHQQPTTLD